MSRDGRVPLLNLYLNDRIAEEVWSGQVQMSRDSCISFSLPHHSSTPHPITERGWDSRDITAESTDKIAYKSLKMLIKCWNRTHAFWSVRASTEAFS